MRTTVFFRLDHPGASMETLSWPELRDFLEVLNQALVAMPGVSATGQLLPVGLAPGSIQVKVSVHQEDVPALRLLQKGPTKRWTPTMFQGVRPLADFVSKKGGALAYKQRGTFRPVLLPSLGSAACHRTVGEIVGTVEWVGGKDGKVDLVTGLKERISCEAGRDLSVQLARYLYRKVIVQAEYRRDVHGGKYDDCRLRSFRPLPNKSMAEGLDELKRLAGLVDFDPRAFLSEVRG